MPIPVINYAGMQPQGNPLWASILPSIMQGLKLGAMPKAIRQESQGNELQNILKAIQAQYAPREAEADIQQKEAMAKFPFFGKSLPGAAGEVLGLEVMKQLYGEQSPQYQQALQAYQLGQQGDKSRIGYQDALAKTLPLRTLTTGGKEIVEQGNIESGNSPTGTPYTNPPRTPAQELANIYDLKRQKGATDTDTRQRNLFATNIEKTLSRINPSDLTQYGGALGTVTKKSDKILSAFSLEPARFDRFETNMQDVEFLTSQIRQFYGDSIQPVMLERLNRLANPATWSNNPRLAKRLFDETKKVLEIEMKTYRDALKDTAVYQGKNAGLTISPKEIKILKKAGVGKEDSSQSGYDPLELI